MKLSGAEDAENLLSEGCLTVVNTRDLGALTIEKKVNGLSSEVSGEMKFTFKVTGPKDANGTYGGNVEFKEGIATVTIPGEGSVTIQGLPTGAYRVEEDTTDVQITGMGLSVSYLDTDQSDSEEEKDVTNDGIVTVLKDGADTKMTVTNTYTNDSHGDGPNDPPKLITDPDVPKTDVPELPDEPAAEIPDEPTPADEYTDPGETGDSSLAWILAAAVSGIGLVWLSLSSKKRKDENAE